MKSPVLYKMGIIGFSPFRNLNKNKVCCPNANILEIDPITEGIPKI